MAERPKRIGEILIAEGVITPEQLEAALKEGGGRVGKTLVRLGFVTDELISKALAHQFRVDFIRLNDTTIPPDIIALLPESLVRKLLVIPLSKNGDELKISMVDPLNVLTVDEVHRFTRLDVDFVLSTESDILGAIDRHYISAKSIEDAAKTEDISRLELLDNEVETTDKLIKIADEASVVRLVNTIVAEAAEKRASDIHMEPSADLFRVRFRVDGILHDAANLNMTVHPAVISRIKILGNMDIAEKRLPQDGRFVMRVGRRGAEDVRLSGAKVQSPTWQQGMRRRGDREIDVRLSTLPTVFGEKIEMRLLDKGMVLLDFNELTSCVNSVAVIDALIKRPYGMILVTGPTGSGKSTAIYAMLNRLNSVERNIVTVEDPVEYQIKRLNQVQINPKAGLTFAEALRHILRQDPDIIMVGEIRDRETVEIAIHAALTGHLVLSTLHTTDAAGTMGRIIDMGIEPFLVASSVIGIASQRLLRKICQDCRKSYKPEDAVIKEFNLPENAVFYRGEGCANCKGEGYLGRSSIIEVLTMTETLRALTLQKADSGMIRNRMKENGFSPLREEGIKAALSGVTTIEEVMRVTQDIGQ